MKHYPITVFTPTYNRAYCLSGVYDSLCRQSCKDFEWLIIDDGSSDNTRELVESWIRKQEVSIRYIYQENQGMHGAHNTAYENIESELNICCDSDDELTDDAIEIILKHWNKHKPNNFAGIIALDMYKSGEIIGTKLPEHVQNSTECALREIYHVKGDKKLIYKTSVAKEVPEYPVFEDEKYGSMGYKSLLIDQKYTWLMLNKPVCIVEYREDGSSMNMYKQYRRAPKGWDIMRKLEMQYFLRKRDQFRKAIHYVSNSIFLHKWNFIQDSPKKTLTIAAIPLGILLNIFIRIKAPKY